ncbi:MAG: hypothetical protein BK997_02960 [Candidatus Micrarchaeum sp. ARMAN-1]|nr:MAG: hypothetical protein BK997_02960 [Candidatus Micrarchaeum sp. ARMAN-1]
MNLSFTLLDASAPKEMPKYDGAKLAAEKAIFDALLHDKEFREMAKGLYESNNTDELSMMLKSVISNEIKMEISDLLFQISDKPEYWARAKPEGTEPLFSAMEMLDSKTLDMVSVYKNAEGMLEILLGMLR